jgi:AraC-like DNA-binding protein
MPKNNALSTRKTIAQLRQIAAGILDTADFLSQEDDLTQHFTAYKHNSTPALHQLNICIANQTEGQRLCIAELCKELGLSRAALYRHFREVLPLAPAHYVLMVRLVNAGALLATGQYNVGEVAFKTGFRDESHFIKVFKKYFGQTPARWRQRSALKIP